MVGRTNANSNLVNFEEKTVSKTFTASINYASIEFEFDFEHEVLGALKFQSTGTSMNNGGDSAVVPIWSNVAIGRNGNKLTVPLRGLTKGTSYTLAVTAIGY